MIVIVFKEIIFSLPKNEMPQHEEWKEKEKRKECTFSEERSGITAEEEKGINDDLLRD